MFTTDNTAYMTGAKAFCQYHISKNYGTTAKYAQVVRQGSGK